VQFLNSTEISDFIAQNFTEEDKYDFLLRTRKLKSLNESEISDDESFDIFLSHSYKDRDLILGIKAFFEKSGFSVYVDWINDRLLNRDNVTKDTAAVLQKRMLQSKSLIYATSENASQSKWMPWETGYFDGIRNRMVAILPISDKEIVDKPFVGQEYLGLYPYIAIDSLDKNFIGTPMMMERQAFESILNEYRNIYKLFVYKDSQSYVLFDEWIKGEKPLSPLEKMEAILENLKK
jgi:hypothetical protein